MKMADFGTVIPSRQQDHSRAFYYQRQTEADITINWKTMDAAAIVALINACNPWNKGAVTNLNNNVIRLLDAGDTGLQTGNTDLPGTVLSLDEAGMKVATAAGGTILVRMIYSDEGFLMSSRLKDFGVGVGATFDP
jgi:methionyl-tRNA formyltransferase